MGLPPTPWPRGSGRSELVTSAAPSWRDTAPWKCSRQAGDRWHHFGNRRGMRRCRAREADRTFLDRQRMERASIEPTVVSPGGNRCIAHCDADRFYYAVEVLERPELAERGRPVVVGHDPRTAPRSIVTTANDA